MADAAKPFELIYSRQKTDFIPGRAYSNPRFFIGPRADVTKVYIVGDWPNIAAAYKARGVPVEQMDEASAVAGATEAAPVLSAPQSLTPTVAADERSRIEIPEDWQTLKWIAPANELSMRALAAQLSDTPVLNKAQAVAAITAEVARRAAAAPQEGAQ